MSEVLHVNHSGVRASAISLLLLLVAIPCTAQVSALVEHHDNNHATKQFKFDKVPPPARDDAATEAKFTIVYGEKDANANDVDRLHDGKVPDWEDQPGRNFAFATGDGGRIQVDLRRAIDVAQVNSYSWHLSTRAPQVYKLYASDGTAQHFDPQPAAGTDPLTCGWSFVTAIDTRPKEGERGGQYGVSISDASGSIGHFQYLLFDISRTETNDDWGNTFYSEIDVVERGAQPAPVAEYWSPPARRDPPGDPMDWKPPAEPPPIRARYGDTWYATSAKAARAKIDLAALRAADRPVGGVLVQEVLPDSPAEKLGIAVGDILMSVDGIPLGSHGDDEDMNATRNGDVQQLRLWSARSGQRTVEIQPGKIGLRYYTGQRLAETYARSSERDPRWDDDMLVATASYASDPMLAETALFHARQAGFRGRLFTPLAARIAFNQCRFEDTLAYGWPAWSANQKLSRDTIRMYYTAAMLGFKPEQALDLATRYPDDLTKENAVAAMVTAYRAMPRSELSNPIAELDNVKRTRTPKFNAFVPTKDHENVEASKWAASLLNDPQPLSLEVPSGSYASMLLTPGYENAALTIHFEVHDTDTKQTGWAHCIGFGLYNMEQSQDVEPLAPDAIKVSLMTDGPVDVSAFGLPEIRFDLPRSNLTATRLEGTIRMVILHNRCQVTLDDGKRIYYGPVTSEEPKRKYGFFIQAVGVSGRVLVPVWERLDDPRRRSGLK